MTPQELKNAIDKPVFHLVGESADELGVKACVVGGYVRDLLLERHSKDIDFVAVGSGIELARKVAASMHARVSVLPHTAQPRSRNVVWSWSLWVRGARAIRPRAVIRR